MYLTLAVSTPLCSVVVQERLPSSGQPLIVVLFDGKPIKKAKIEVYRFESDSGDGAKPQSTMLTNKNGEALTKTLRHFAPANTISSPRRSAISEPTYL
jgi:hypothetical protein